MTTFTYQFCRRQGCGHDSIVHQGLVGRCYGVRVTGIPNTDDAGEDPCECQAFTTERKLMIELPEITRV